MAEIIKAAGTEILKWHHVIDLHWCWPQ